MEDSLEKQKAYKGLLNPLNEDAKNNHRTVDVTYEQSANQNKSLSENNKWIHWYVTSKTEQQIIPFIYLYFRIELIVYFAVFSS